MVVCVCMHVPICIPFATRAGRSSVDLYAEGSDDEPSPFRNIAYGLLRVFSFSHPFKLFSPLELLKCILEDQHCI